MKIAGPYQHLGLGLMAPIRDTVRDLMVFPLSPEPAVAIADAPALLHAVRRALMALSRDDKQKRNNKKNQAAEVDRLFSGHETDGAPARANGHEHIFLAADDADRDGWVDRIIVAAPWICDRTKPEPPRWKRALFERVATKTSNGTRRQARYRYAGPSVRAAAPRSVDWIGGSMGKPHSLSPDPARGARQEPGGSAHRGCVQGMRAARSAPARGHAAEIRKRAKGRQCSRAFAPCFPGRDRGSADARPRQPQGRRSFRRRRRPRPCPPMNNSNSTCPPRRSAARRRLCRRGW